MNAYKIVWKRQLFFSHVTFLSPSEFSVELNIVSWHANTHLTNRRFLDKQFLMSKHLSI